MVFRHGAALEARRVWPLPSFDRLWAGAIDAIGAFAEVYSRRWQNGLEEQLTGCGGVGGGRSAEIDIALNGAQAVRASRRA